LIQGSKQEGSKAKLEAVDTRGENDLEKVTVSFFIIQELSRLPSWEVPKIFKLK
jgi:hypothetical protein